jgi:hypothetical protein
MNEYLKAILILIVYFLVQSFVLAIFAALIWNILLINTFSIYLGYFHWVGIMFIIQLLRFDTVEKINNFNKMMMDGQKITKLQKKDERDEVQ